MYLFHAKRNLRTDSSNRERTGKIKMKILYPAHITYEPGDNRYTVQSLDLEEAITEGESLEEARFNASEVLTLTLESRMDEKIEIPFPSDSKDADFIAPSAEYRQLLIHFAKGEGNA
jgi:antitoxin HicB